MWRAVVFGFFLTLLAGSALADTAGSISVGVGSPLVNGDALRPYTNAWHMVTIDSTGRTNNDAGTWSDRLEIVYIGGRKYMQRTQEAKFKTKSGAIAATTQTINVFDPTTLAPLTREFKQHVVATGQSSDARTSFSNGLVTVTSTANGKTETRSMTEQIPAFDFYGGIYALLWVALPLKPGFSASFPSFEESDPLKVSRVTYKVTGSDTIHSAGRSVTAWVVQCDSDIGALKYWIVSTPPYILRMNYKDNTRGTTWILTEAV